MMDRLCECGESEPVGLKRIGGCTHGISGSEEK